MKKFKKVLAMGLFISLCLGIVGCSAKAPDSSSTEKPANTSDSTDTSGSGKKVEITIATNWGEGDSKYDYFYPAFQKFQEENKDTMDIKLQTYGTEDYKTKIKVQTASGDLPDAFTYWGGSMMNDMIEAGLLANVDTYFNDSTAVKRDDFNPASFAYYTSADGNTYGVPIESTRGVFLANKDLFDQYGLQFPKTYEELKEVSKVFNDNGIIPIAIGSSGGTPSEFFFSELYNQYSGAAEEIQNLATTKKFATENALKVANNIKNMIDDKMFPADTVANGGWAASLQLYTDRKAAMTYTYPWMFESIPEDIQNSSEIIPVPMLPDASVDPAGMMTGFTVYGFVINKKSYEDQAKHEAMIKVCDFLASNDLSVELTKSGMIPAKNIEVDLSSQKIIYQKMMNFSKDKTLTQVHFTTMPKASAITAMDSSLDELFISGITPQEFIDKVQAELDRN
ncbi:ABC transporter substrate-binding protein [Anaerocolumna xylanovorans]|uniref:ABC-type glycerol-3-phosphate transport system, substrate-binding protein n=1 Tax=Anaerocolumna xylanovorans DSM 12503 TaxID=1121345 RepID=A0A1M7YCW8_9FIRM|nr:extracellular solute-binding protein [Anaerocolumna xylanovorans]SHO50477.1 ABC-type glycerol-3-phosphate transport system, substrate-binding protein [Anaerocolumna xylanovorans DSM 12503]